MTRFQKMLTTLPALALLGFIAAPALAHCGACEMGTGHSHDKGDKKADKPDIVEIAAGNDDFSTLVAAVQAAGLVETLKGDGPFTVFAPTNEAFAALPEGTVESLLKPENKDKLIAVLTYHVVPGKVTAADVVKLDKATTVQGSDVKITASDAGVKVNEANVISTDIMASNGVIHVIDAVILPPMDE